MQAYSNPKCESDPYSLPDIEVFYVSKQDAARLVADAIAQGGHIDTDPEIPISESGWYWWACLPGCLPDSDANGPFATSAEALADAQSNADDEDDN